MWFNDEMCELAKRIGMSDDVALQAWMLGADDVRVARRHDVEIGHVWTQSYRSRLTIIGMFPLCLGPMVDATSALEFRLVHAQDEDFVWANALYTMYEDGMPTNWKDSEYAWGMLNGSRCYLAKVDREQDALVMQNGKIVRDGEIPGLVWRPLLKNLAGFALLYAKGTAGPWDNFGHMISEAGRVQHHANTLRFKAGEMDKEEAEEWARKLADSKKKAAESKAARKEKAAAAALKFGLEGDGAAKVEEAPKKARKPRQEPPPGPSQEAAGPAAPAPVPLPPAPVLPGSIAPLMREEDDDDNFYIPAPER